MAPLEYRECLEWRDQKDPLELMAHLVHKDLLDQTGLQGIGELLVCLDRLDQLGQEEPKDLKVSVEIPASLVRKDHQDHLDCKDHPVLLDREEREVRKDRLVNQGHLGLVEGLATRALQDLQE